MDNEGSETGILETRVCQASVVSAKNDREWNTALTRQIGPHPAISETRSKVISLENVICGGKAKIKVRRLPLYHALGRRGLDTDLGARKLQGQQTALLNREVIHDDHE